MDKLKSKVTKALSYMILILLIVMTGLVLWQVITRYILGNPSVFTEELVRIILIWTSFFSAAYAFGTRQHMSLIFLKEKSKGKRKIFIYILIDIIILLFAFIVLIYGGLKVSSSVIEIKTPILKISRGIIYSCSYISGIIIVFYQITNILEDLKIDSADKTK